MRCGRASSGTGPGGRLAHVTGLCQSPVGVSSQLEPAASSALGIPLPGPLCPPPRDSLTLLTSCLPPAATPWRAPNKIDLYDVRRRPW